MTRRPPPGLRWSLLGLGLSLASPACGDDTSDGNDPTDATTTTTAGTEPTSAEGPPTPGDSSTSIDPDDSTTGAPVTDTGASSSETGAGDDEPPLLVIESPRSGATVPVRRVLVTGTVADEQSGLAELAYDGPAGPEAIDVQGDGSFSAAIEPPPGPSTHHFTATDNAGNTTEVEVDVYFGHRVGVGNSQAAYLREGTLFSWGRNELGQLGNGTLEGSGWGDDPETSSLPVRYEIEVEDLVSIVTRQTFMVGLRDDGSVLTWGSGAAGQLGYEANPDCGNSGTSPCSRTPTVVAGLSDVVAIGAGFEHTLVLDADGMVWTFGDNEYGQLGDPSAPATRMTPTMVPALADIIQVAAASHASYALTEAGDVYAWGENDRGQLGLGTTDDGANPTPMLVDGLDDVVQLAAANTTTYALRVDGTVWAWGRNHAGQAGIGDPSGADVLEPTMVVDEAGRPLTDIVAVSGDGFVGLALDRDGQVHAWGFGFLGQLGQGYTDGGERDLEDRVFASPVAVSARQAEAFDILEIEVGAGGPALALSADGNLFGWGWSFQGSLGLEGAINAWAYSAPVLVFAAD
ncbi:MAG: hypothetical protein AAF799_32055 [Myxococcota bacterium]